MNRAERRAQERYNRRFVLNCALCGEEFENETQTLGAIEREHFMRWHDITKIQFTLRDRKTGQRRVLN